METLNGVTRESAPNKPERHSCVCKKCVVAILIILVVGIICTHIHRPKLGLTPDKDCTVLGLTPDKDCTVLGLTPGKNCTVQFRRDALGGAANLPVPPTTPSINGATVAIQGKLIAVSHEAILLSSDGDKYVQGKQLWIPKSSILLIQYND